MKFFTSERVKKYGRAFFEGFYCVGTAAASAYVLWWFLPMWLAALIFSVVFVHEMGHYIAGLAQGVESWLPFFLPLVYALFGGTYTNTDDPNVRKWIDLAGPFAGILVAVVWAIVGFATGFTPLVWAALWQVFFQLISGTIGSDGRKYWRHRRDAQAQEAGFFTATVPA
jgi:hypothetical protein